MKANTHTTTYLFSLLLLLFSLVIPSFSLATDTATKKSLAQNTLVIQGKIKGYNSDKQTILLKTVKGEKMTITLDWKTGLIGYSSPQEIERGHGVKIWYSVKEKKYHAVKIEKKLDVGC